MVQTVDGDDTLFTLEADLLNTRLTQWALLNIGGERDNNIYLSLTPERQKNTLEVLFRFLCSSVISLDLSNQILEKIDNLKEWFTRCSYLVDILQNNNNNNNNNINNNNNNTNIELHKYTVSYRTKVRSLLRLFQLVSSTDYLQKLINEDKVLKLGALTLHLWGESLLNYCETSLRYWKPQCTKALLLAENMFMKCLLLSPNRHQTAYFLGQTLILLAKSDKGSNEYKKLLEKAYKSVSFAVQLLPAFPAYTSALAKLSALLGKESECETWLKSWISSKPHNPLSLLEEAEFDRFRTRTWFHGLIESLTPKLSSGFDDKRYDLLQNSLLESGFSMKKLLELINWLPISTGQSQIKTGEENDYVKKQKDRLQQRLELYQLKPKRDIPGDGNCQMHAISDQLYDTIAKSGDIRKMVVDWLQKNKDWQLPNGAILHQFVHDRPWDEYTTAMAKDGCWGDHLTLLAISEMFGAQISIFSSVEGDNFITEIHPTTKKVKAHVATWLAIY